MWASLNKLNAELYWTLCNDQVGWYLVSKVSNSLQIASVLPKKQRLCGELWDNAFDWGWRLLHAAVKGERTELTRNNDERDSNEWTGNVRDGRDSDLQGKDRYRTHGQYKWSAERWSEIRMCTGDGTTLATHMQCNQRDYMDRGDGGMIKTGISWTSSETGEMSAVKSHDSLQA